VDSDDLHVRDHDRDRERARRRRPAGTPLPLVRIPRRERRPALGGAQAPDVGVLVFFPGALLIADSPNVNGARNDAITAKMIPIATANQPPPESSPVTTMVKPSATIVKHRTHAGPCTHTWNRFTGAPPCTCKFA